MRDCSSSESDGESQEAFRGSPRQCLMTPHVRLPVNFPGTDCSHRSWRKAIEITIKGNRTHKNIRTLDYSLFQIDLVCAPFCPAKLPAAIMDHDTGGIWIVKRRCDAIHRGFMTAPLWRNPLAQFQKKHPLPEAHLGVNLTLRRRAERGRFPAQRVAQTGWRHRQRRERDR